MTHRADSLSSPTPPPSAPTRRRWFLSVSCSLAIAGLGCSSAERALAQPSYTISAQQITETVAQKFPRKFGMGGLLDLQLLAPRIQLVPDRNSLNAVIDLIASGPLLQQRNYNGALDVDFGLRYEPSDRSLRATQIRFNGLRMQGLNAQATAMLQRYGAQIAEQSLQEVVLYRLSEADLALADGLGFQPGKFTVTPKGLTVELERKPLP